MTTGKHSLKSLLGINAIIAIVLIFLTLAASELVTVIALNDSLPAGHCIVIDAGHGGIDGGTSAADGYTESVINLQITQRLDPLLQLLGYKTLMIRSTDRSMHTQGTTIAAQKVSDLKERVRMIMQVENPLLVSIHQNYFTDSRYSGAQVFYNSNAYSKELADLVQARFCATVNPGSHRKSKASSGIYLMANTTCPGILVECGFLSNFTESHKLRNNTYQKHMCCVIASSIASFLDRKDSC